MDFTAHFKLLEKLYLAAPINAVYQPKIQIREDYTRIAMDLSPQYYHGAGAVHGAIMFKIMDDAGFFAANSLVPEFFVLTANFSIHFFRPVLKGPLIGVGEVINRGKRQILVDTFCYTEESQIIARGRGIYMKSKFPLQEYSEYQKLIKK